MERRWPASLQVAWPNGQPAADPPGRERTLPSGDSITGEVVSILFVEPVMSNDISTPSSGTAPSESPSSGRPLTPGGGRAPGL